MIRRTPATPVRHCVVCGEPTDPASGQSLCESCRRPSRETYPPANCWDCGRELADEESCLAYCPDCGADLWGPDDDELEPNDDDELEPDEDR